MTWVTLARLAVAVGILTLAAILAVAFGPLVSHLLWERRQRRRDAARRLPYVYPPNDGRRRDR